MAVVIRNSSARQTTCVARFVIYDSRMRQYVRFSGGQQPSDRRKSYLTPHRDNASRIEEGLFEHVKHQYALKPYEDKLWLEAV